MELRAGVRSGLGGPLRAALVAALVALALPGAAAAQDPQLPESQTEPPRFFERTANEAERIAARADKVREAREDGPLDPTAYTRGAGRWQVSFFRDGDEVVQVLLDDRSGAVLEQWDGDQVAWRMARGYSGAFGRKLNAPWVWIPLCLLFLLPFIDFRRPFRLLHLDLLVLVSFGLSHVFFNRGEIGVSAPLVYPVLLYLLLRVLLAAFRPRERPGRLVPHVPLAWLAVALVFLVAFRVALNAVDSNVIDVGYAGVIGADRVVDGDELYGEGFSEDVERGDTYGPVTYLLYVPFEQALKWSGAWDDLPAAHGAAIAFDLLAIGGMLLLGRALRPGREGGRWASGWRGPGRLTRTRPSCWRRTRTTPWSRWRASAPCSRLRGGGGPRAGWRSGSGRRRSSRRWPWRRCSRGARRWCSRRRWRSPSR